MVAAIDRRQGIGASEVAAIAGASPWTTPVALWLEKVGLAGARSDTPAMSAGRALERPLLRLASDQLGIRFTHNRRSFRHPGWPAVPLYATPDGFGPGRRALIEIKLVGHRWSDWAEGPPEYVGLQVQAQLACLPRTEIAYVAALLGSELRCYRIEREPAIQSELPALLGDWWARHVVTERSPAPSESDDVWALLRLRVAPQIGDRSERLATPDEQVLGGELTILLAEQDALTARIAERRELLADLALDADIKGLSWSAGWSERGSVDWRGLAQALQIPEHQIREFTRTSSSFTFRRSRGGSDG